MRWKGSALPLSLLLLLGMLVACGESSGVHQEWVVERDSAGIVVVESQAPAWSGGPGWAIGTDPVVVIGEQDADLFNVVFAGALSDGRVVVVDSGSRTVRWYGSDGSDLGRAGGTGEGPGEFRGVVWAGVTASDSVYVWDSQARRMSVLADGEFVRDFRLEIPDPWGPVSIGGVLLDGSVVAMATPLPGGEGREGVYRPDVPVWITSPDGEVQVTIGSYPSAAVQLRPASTPGAVIRGVVPFGPRTVISAARDRIIVGDSDRYELALHDGEGALRRIVRVPRSTERVSDVDLQLELERRLEVAPPVEEIRDGIRANFEATPVPEIKPYYDRFLLDPEGHVWVRRVETRADGEGEHWDVLDADGGWLGSVQFPSQLELTQVTTESVLGVWRDEYGVESIRGFTLERSTT